MTDTYRIREATLADADALVRHRIGMFTDMGVPLDAPSLETAFRAWLSTEIPAGTYRAWVVETAAREVVAGGAISILPWPPGPRYLGNRLAYIYNVYTEPAHRRRGLARRLMETIHAWCCDAGITSTALNASADGRPLYEALGYHVAPNPMMFFSIAEYNPPAQASTGPAT